MPASVLGADLTITPALLATYAGQPNILLQATGNIIFSAGVTVDLSGNTGLTAGTITLQAGGNIIFNSGSILTDENNWSVNLMAGYQSGAVQPGTGNIYLNGGSGNTLNGSIQLAQGNLNLTAGNSVLVGTGYVITTGGGSINAHALAGNIDTGGDAQGYHFFINSAAIDSLSSGLGGISTMAGGNVSLTAGGNVSSLLPSSGGYNYDGAFHSSTSADVTTAGAGAYGSQTGNVTIIAGGNVTGHYLAANGSGNIFAGVEMDANGNPLTNAVGNYLLAGTGSAGTSFSSPNFALSLVSGSWSVAAAQNIFLQEVRNPNGVFNVTGATGVKHYFNYAPSAVVSLTAGNLVQLGAQTSMLPRLNSTDHITVPCIYPSSLNITSGAGGVLLTGDSTFNQLILFPSPQGSLTINTTNGGSLSGSLPAISGVPQIFNLIVSASSRSQYNSGTGGYFGLNDYATLPVHLFSEKPVNLNISGDMDLVLLGAPEAAQITVGGNLNNCRFQGMNLANTDVTSINVTGDINDRGAFTSVNLGQVAGAQTPNFSVLPYAIGSSPSATTLSDSFYYDPVTQLLTYQNINGVSLASVLSQLQNLTVQVYSNGIPQWADPPNDTVPLTSVVSALNAADANALLAQYNALGPAPGSYGYNIGGGGQFNITARNCDLGTTAGIISSGVGLYSVSGSYPLASFFTSGANINLTLSSNLTMYSTSIASLNGGNIAINAGGAINIGSTQYTITSTINQGIYSTAQGNISVVAGGDTIINGSRVAAYDGGNVTIQSLSGNVNAGNGGLGSDITTSYKVDPNTGQVKVISTEIPGSGILATTFPTDASQTVGNINVTAQNIYLGCDAITQTPLNGTSGSAATTTLQALENIYCGGCDAVTSSGWVNFTAGGTITGVIVSLQAQVNTTSLAAVAGTNVQFTVTAQGTPPFFYKWFKDSTVLTTATNASLSLTNISRADAGTYSIVVSNGSGTVTNNIQLHVQVPQQLNISFAPTNNLFTISFSDADGGVPTAQDIPTFILQNSTDLVNWTDVDLSATTNENGSLSFQVSPSADIPQSYWRILSQ